MPKVAILVPTYNRVNKLKECINGILNQSYQDFIIIVSDNCSTDNTEELINSYEDTRIIYTKNSHNLGQFRNFMSCIEKVKDYDVDYCSLVSDDDLWGKELLARAISSLNKWKDTSIYCANTYKSGYQKNIWNSYITAPFAFIDPLIQEPQIMSVDQAFLIGMLHTSFYLSACVMKKDDFINEFEILNPSVGWGQDWLVTANLSLKSGIIFDPMILCYAYTGAGTESKRTDPGLAEIRQNHENEVHAKVYNKLIHQGKNPVKTVQSVLKDIPPDHVNHMLEFLDSRTYFKISKDIRETLETYSNYKPNKEKRHSHLFKYFKAKTLQKIR